MGHAMELIERKKEVTELPYEQLVASYYQLQRQLSECKDEIQRLNKENSAMSKELRSAQKMREEFLSIASHELRTPITALHLSLQLLERNVRKNAGEMDVQRISSLAQNSIELSRRVFSLQEILMDLTKISRGHLGLNLSHGELCEVTRNAISQFGVLSKDVKITVHTHQPIQGVFDSARIYQVITNLVSNSIKYGDQSPISINLSSCKGLARVEVSDRGPGIPHDIRGRIFERFARSSSDSCQAGLGLGLYVSKQIIEAHGGTLNVHSAIGEGTRFIAEFPLTGHL